MTNPTKQVAIGFSARAFLTPRHLPADKLLEWVDNDDLMKLKPSAEQVRDAILLCKQHGIHARFTSGIALSISGDALALHTCFGVRLIIDSDPKAKERKWFEDDAGAKQGLVKPVANHPLVAHIVNILLEPGIEAAISSPPTPAPHYPGTRQEWGKKEPYHIWPHELCDRMSFKSRGRNSDDIATLEFMRHSKEIDVILIDSGVDDKHPYFQDFSMRPGRGQSPRLQYPTTHLKSRITKFRSQVVSIMGEIESILELLGDIRINDIFAEPASQAKSLQFYNDILKITGTNVYATFTGQAQGTNRLRQIFADVLVANGKWQPNPKPDGGSDEIMALQLELAGFESYLKSSLSIAIETENRLNDFRVESHDYSGHGTAMAASIFGVAKSAQIASYTTIFEDEEDHLQIFTAQLRDDIDCLIEEVIDWAIMKPDERRSNPFGNASSCRVVSNSYSTPVRTSVSNEIDQSDMQRINDQRLLCKRYVHVQKFSFLYSAANSDSYADDRAISLYALLGESGAIIVGGAFDNVQLANEVPPQRELISRQVTLSNASHGTVVAMGSDRATLPDVCGFVGPRDVEAKASPYVYLPRKSPSWSYGGGGTSSACAQVAALCAALRAKFPNLGPLQVKKAIMLGGDAIQSGTSFQGKKVADLGFVKLANILGAFRICAQFAVGSRVIRSEIQ